VDDAVRSFGEDLGRRALGRDWAGVHSLLAPWMQRSMTVDDVRTFFESEYQGTLTANGIEQLHYPENPEPEIGGNDFTKASALREPISFQGGKVRPVAPEVTHENMRYWLKVQLQCSDEQMNDLGFDYLCEIWAAVVDTPEGLRVGYWSQGAY
jgi:hypothetical protein